MAQKIDPHSIVAGRDDETTHIGRIKANVLLVLSDLPFDITTFGLVNAKNISAWDISQDIGDFGGERDWRHGTPKSHRNAVVVEPLMFEKYQLL